MSESAGRPESNTRQRLTSLIEFTGWVILVLSVFGATSLACGVYCTFSQDRFWFGWVMPLILFGIFLITSGIRVLQLRSGTQKLRLTLSESTLAQTASDRITGIIPLLRKFMHFTTICLLAGIGLLLPSCVFLWPFILGFSIALIMQSGLIAVGIMFIVFRLEIYHHELERGGRPSG